ncbi:MAG: alanine racemase [Calditrichaceae bacterium]|nr:alanine racemase [Calditrichia bacterium]NUQ42141.1 alanine racemase [Calditrichaceae bacterium]
MIDSTRFYTTWVEISESAYAHNLKFFRNIIGPGPELSVVVKANAYGHGWQAIAGLAVKHGADSFSVHSLEEALKLRKAGFPQDILIMGPVPGPLLEAVAAENFRLVAFNRETILRLQEAAAGLQKTARVHLKLETGTHRQGISREELGGFLRALQESPAVQLEGVYTHFANIEDTTSHDYAFQQIRRFEEMSAAICQAGFPALKQHSACTAAALLFRQTHLDMVRLGIGQYGLWPSRETLVSYKIKYDNDVEKILRPVLAWKTRITQLKDLKAGDTIGYGRTYKTTRNSRIAVLPVGYSDGYDRGLSNQGYVLIRGKHAPVRGRVCMNLLMVDVTDIPEAQLEDEAVLLGRQGEEEISAEQLAGMCGTINYEIVSRINREIPRVLAA